MNNRLLLERLQTLLERFSCLSVDAGIAALSLIEAWGLYLHLRHLAGGE